MIFVNIDAITEYILSITPAISALVAVAVIVAVGVGKIKNALKDNGEIVERSWIGKRQTEGRSKD